jgi:hypothetical protein
LGIPPPFLYAAAIEEAKKAWIERNKAFMNKHATPQKVFYTYCKNVGLTEDQIINELDWDFFSEDEE